MESFNENKKIGNIKGQEIYRKVKGELLKILKQQNIKINNIENQIEEMTAYVFNEILAKLDENTNKKTAEENFRENFELEINWKEFEKDILDEINNINSYGAVKKSGLNTQTIKLFQINPLKSKTQHENFKQKETQEQKVDKKYTGYLNDWEEKNGK